MDKASEDRAPDIQSLVGQLFGCFQSDQEHRAPGNNHGDFSNGETLSQRDFKWKRPWSRVSVHKSMLLSHYGLSIRRYFIKGKRQDQRDGPHPTMKITELRQLQKGNVK